MAETDADAVIPLQEWLKLLQTHGVPMRAAMGLAAKAYKEHNTREKLAKLPVDKFVPDKEGRKSVVVALRAITAGKTAKKKRARDDDLLLPLEPAAPTLPKTLDFHEILDPEQLIPVTVTVNRAPVKTAWAYTVARRLGFDAQEALSLAHVYVHIGSMKHALSLGNIYNAQQTHEAEEEIRELPGEADYRRPGAPTSPQKRRGRGEVVEKAVGSSQPWVMLLRTNPVIERPDGTWRAIQKGLPVEPSVAYLYITRALKDLTPHVMGAMQLVANSYDPEELNAAGVAIYSAFKPDVVEWGQRGGVAVADILDQIKTKADDSAETEVKAGHEGPPEGEPAARAEVRPPATPASPRSEASSLTPAPSEDAAPEAAQEAARETDEPPAKRQKEMTLEEYEAMLDDDFDEELYNIP
ncbi:hypothetical protein CC85DRAFT_320100 [Cutaneotrichosporon oleaginosum]|uniref:Uncharacterized protein n=1 Tax=Cutaneotrichosporon oleaginosum TaxID=879819 RepID=A0A0J0XKE5_9TREE|nr:uncharacterized protein CC85DRAFT_320100 [Cutaneotrichosporon oleaginosum]KLT41565.1 hypothetical protein CC85DRAFT_320100 [Cutaneotrichosporon oleaginosum]TXT09331.1 hypothetical protein COLE_03265 [Cutaneotrichosporon oleaginosum]